MISISNIKIKNIPCLVIVQHEKRSEPLPVITYYHGFTSAKEHNLPIAYLLAEEGYRVILPDSMHHGEREGNITALKRQVAFWDMVIENVKELAIIRTYLQQHHLIEKDKIGVAGTSMGGITTAAALVKYPWIDAAAVLMGSPKPYDFATYMIEEYKKTDYPEIPPKKIEALDDQLLALDLSRNKEVLQNRPLLFWHGDADPIVPFEHAYDFYRETREIYQQKKNLHFIREKGRGHKVSRLAVLETVKWFREHLS